MPEPTPEQLVQKLTTLLDVEEIDTDLYRGARLPGGVGRVFGGQVIAQALQSAQRSIDGDKIAHSLHAYFMRPGDEAHPIMFSVRRDFEGRSFATRRIIATQKGVPILNMAASFQTFEDGLSHQDAMPDVPMPEDLTPERELRTRELSMSEADNIPEKLRNFILRARPVELRACEPRSWVNPGVAPPRQNIWFRIVAPLPDDLTLHRAMLAYASDMALLGTCLLPHNVNWMLQNFQTASLDHAVWFHEPFRFDDWLLYSCDSPWAGHARGFNRGQVFSRDGRLVASVSQEGLIRPRVPKAGVEQARPS